MPLNEKTVLNICRSYFGCFKDHIEDDLHIEYVGSIAPNEYQFEVRVAGSAEIAYDDVILNIEQQGDLNSFSVSIGCITHFSSVERMPITGLEEDFGFGDSSVDEAYDQSELNFCWGLTIPGELAKPTLYEQLAAAMDDIQLADHALQWYVTKVILAEVQDPVTFLISKFVGTTGRAPYSIDTVVDHVVKYLETPLQPGQTRTFNTVDEFITLIQS